MTDYEQDYESFWKELVEKDGKLDPDSVKRELFDYHNLMKNATRVYCHITDGMISKLNTDPDVVIAEADSVVQKLIDEAQQGA